MNGSPIQLCKNFSYISAAGGVILFDWMGFDSSYQTADLVIEAKLVDTGTVDVAVESSTDASLVTALGSTAVSAVGVITTVINTDLMQMIRLRLSSAAAAAMTLSVWLLPKPA